LFLSIARNTLLCGSGYLGSKTWWFCTCVPPPRSLPLPSTLGVDQQSRKKKRQVGRFTNAQWCLKRVFCCSTPAPANTIKIGSSGAAHPLKVSQ
jgi:hypothetical protein